jgi:hypothetical protein
VGVGVGVGDRVDVGVGVGIGVGVEVGVSDGVGVGVGVSDAVGTGVLAVVTAASPNATVPENVNALNATIITRTSGPSVRIDRNSDQSKS